jgi:hypothetical protein
MQTDKVHIQTGAALDMNKFAEGGARAVLRLALGRGCRWGILGVLVVAAAGAVSWLVSTEPETPPARVSRSLPAAGVKRVILRAGAADTAEVTAVPGSEIIEVSGAPTGGAKGYHAPDPNWRETPAAAWGLDFASARHGNVLVISTKNEIHYIHHGYFLRLIVLRVPAGVEVVRQRRELTGDGAPDLRGPGKVKGDIQE